MSGFRTGAGRPSSSAVYARARSRARPRRAPRDGGRALDRDPGNRCGCGHRGSRSWSARPRPRAARADAGRRAGAKPGRAALDPGVAPERLAAGLRQRGAASSGDPSRLPWPRDRAGGSCSARRAARAPNTKHSLSEFEASRLAPCSPVQEHSPIASRPGRLERASRSVGDPAHHVVRCRRDRDQLAPRVQARLLQRGDDGREQSRVDVAHVEVDGFAARQVSCRKIARATSSRGASSSTNRSPVGVEQARPLATDRLGHQQTAGAVAPPTSAVGWNCIISRSASAAPAS